MATTTRDTTPTFSDWLTTTTRALGYARDSDVARALQIDQSIVSRWRKGSQPSVKHLDRISDLTGTPLEPLLVLAGYLHPSRARHGKTLKPAATPGERMINEAQIDEQEKPIFRRYWEVRSAEEKDRLAKLLLLSGAVKKGDMDAATAISVEARTTELSVHIMELYRGIADAHRAEASRLKAKAAQVVSEAEERAAAMVREAEDRVKELEAQRDAGEEGTQAPDPREP